MADLILLTGPPGAGKSTVARELVARPWFLTRFLAASARLRDGLLRFPA